MTGHTYRTLKKRIDGLEPVGVGRNGANLWDSHEALPLIYGHGDKDEDAGQLDPRAEKARLDRARRIAQELKNQELKGELVRAADVREDAFNTGRQVRDALLGISGRVSASCAAESNQWRVSEMLSAEIQQALEGLCQAGQETYQECETVKENGSKRSKK